MNLTDPTGTIEVDVEELRVESVRISAAWKERMDVDSLTRTLTGLLRAALPTGAAAIPQLPTGNKHLPESSIPTFIAELQAGREATRRYIDRLRAGDVYQAPEPHVVGDLKVEVSFAGGRFQDISIDPDWAQKATVQSLCDALLDVLSQQDLAIPSEPEPEILEARKHYAAATACLVERH